MAGRNGSVTSISTSDSGTSVEVDYPAEAGGPGTPPVPPPQAAHSDIYEVSGDRLQSLRDAMNFGHKVDADGANGSNGGTVTVHK